MATDSRDDRHRYRVLGAWQSLFANRKLWHANNVTLAGLYELKWDIEYRKGDDTSSITKDEINDYFNRLRAIRKTAEEALQRLFYMMHRSDNGLTSPHHLREPTPATERVSTRTLDISRC